MLIGIDVGTTNLKVVAAERTGRILAVARRTMRIDRPLPGAAEFDLDTLDRHLVEALREVREQAGPGTVEAIGATSIGESFVGLDRDGRRITACPTWFDGRTRNTRERLGLTPAEWFDITGMVDEDIYTVHRIAWLAEHQPELVAQVVHWLSVSDYVVYRLTGRRVASPALAARTGLADRTSGDWSGRILDAAGIARASLPELLPPAALGGRLLPEIAALTGIAAGTPVANSGQDHACGSLACGLAEPGQLLDSTGTAESLRVVVDRPMRAAETMGGRYDCHPYVVPGLYLLTCHIPTSGALVDWLVRLAGGMPLGVDPPRAVIDQLFAEAEASSPGANGVMVDPYFEGTGPPLSDSHRRGALQGLRSASTRGDLLRAALEALAGWVAFNTEAFEQMVGRRFPEIVLTGGGARSRLSTGIKAALLDRPFVIPEVEEAGALGAGLVAGIAAGVFADGRDAARLPDVGTVTIQPDTALVDAYARLDLARTCLARPAS